jgi:hypothetical protein
MLKLQLLRIAITIFLGFLLLANFAFMVGICTGFAHGGVNGVKQWINHITYEGTGRLKEVSPGVVQFSRPVIEHVYLGFVLDWLFIILLTVICSYAVRYCTRGIHTLEGKHNSGS